MILSIIILNYKTKNLLRLCLKNLLEININFDYEIIVVDNNSQDGSCEMVEEFYPQVKLVKAKHNRGHAIGNNLGIEQAKGKYLLIINTDIIFTDHTDFNKIINFLNINPKIGILGPKLLNGDGTLQNSCYRRYNFFTPLYRRTPLGKMKFAQKDLNRHLMWDFDHQKSMEVEWVLGACMFIRKEFLDKYGNFDERFFLYFADYELCDRAKKAGYLIYYFADAKIIHYHKRESAEGSVWGGVGSLLNYTTRIHLHDWIKYLLKK